MNNAAIIINMPNAQKNVNFRKAKRTGKQRLAIFFCVLIILVIIALLYLIVTFEEQIRNYINPNANNQPVMINQNINEDASNDASKINPSTKGSNTGKDTRLVSSNSNNKTVPSRHVCYLTFDTGPSKNTPKILEILNKYDIRATWFVSTHNTYLNSVKQIWESGNQVAVHSHNSNAKQIYKNTKTFWEDHDTAVAELTKILGFKPANMMRFPGGSSNSYNKTITKKLKAEATSRGIHYFDWNQSSGDGTSKNATKILNNAINKAESKNSICLWMHDTDSNDATVQALEQIIQFYKSKGFSFEYLNEESYGYVKK